ncbi:MAG: hypothetical protein HQL05_10995 [Nitrospirae bacterium]|uniref:helix-turn-helix domain-containing transcriptional regulator n=1 Tax=Candidatus Magnetobacterium casense TaxID=1455061 RepID=UPI000698E81F|nr:hypothetical protein [Candidatus Magnetobacterium casensis]MBF0338347.1 hypothetical protein [Nitrospirota bacterium]
MTDYHDFLIESLRGREEAVEYLNAVLEENDKELFLLALRNIAEAGWVVYASEKSAISGDGICLIPLDFYTI